MSFHRRTQAVCRLRSVRVGKFTKRSSVTELRVICPFLVSVSQVTTHHSPALVNSPALSTSAQHTAAPRRRLSSLATILLLPARPLVSVTPVTCTESCPKLSQCCFLNFNHIYISKSQLLRVAFRG